MNNKFPVRFLLSLSLIFSIFFISLPPNGYAQTAQAQTSGDLQKGLQTIEEKTEARRKELGIPGMSLAIVKDGEVVFAKGFGYKDFEKKIAVTPDTEFAIGSSTKAFTALSILMSQDEGKLSLDDSPKKVLPYFKINDAEIDKAITIRDLLSHSSGLNRTDLAWISGKLTREEIIKVAGEAKPTAKLREKFQYQNVMFAAAGEIVAKVQKKPWEKFVPERIFKPLGMTNSTMAMRDMEKMKDYSFGYDYNFDTKETTRRPFRDIDEVAPAGSINSSAKDMTNWLKFILNGGTVNGKRLVSEKSFEEWLKPQMKIAGKTAYGLGWFIRDWNGLKVVEHGGNIDGFNALVAMIPEKKLGFVMLTNVSGSSLGSELMPIVWSNVLGNPNANQTQTATADELQKEVGKYNFAEAGFDIDVQLKDGKLVAVVPNQPTYTLEKVGARKYKLSGAPDGFYATFKDTEVYLEQPQGNYTLKKVNAAVKTPTAEDSGKSKELIGKYESETNGKIVEVKEIDGKVSLNIAGQTPYALGDKEKDSFTLSPLPETFWLKVQRGADGKIAKIIVVQPEGEFGFKPLSTDNLKITVDEIMSKAIEAAGGEANWRKINSRVSKFELDLENQGVKADGISYAKAPNKSATDTKIAAFGKTIATGYEFFDGSGGEEFYSFAPVDKFSGKRLEDAKLGADFYGLLNWKTNYKKVELERIAKAADEDCYVLTFEPEKGSKVTEYYSTKTFLLLKREGVLPSSTSDVNIPYTVTYSDYRDIDGIKLPFKSVNYTVSNGNTVTYLKEVKHNAPIEDKVFAARK